MCLLCNTKFPWCFTSFSFWCCLKRISIPKSHVIFNGSFNSVIYSQYITSFCLDSFGSVCCCTVAIFIYVLMSTCPTGGIALQNSLAFRLFHPCVWNLDQQITDLLTCCRSKDASSSPQRGRLISSSYSALHIHRRNSSERVTGPPLSTPQITITKCPRLYLLIMQLASFLSPAGFYCMVFEAIGAFVFLFCDTWSGRHARFVTLRTYCCSALCVNSPVFVKWIVNSVNLKSELGFDWVSSDECGGTGSDYQWQRGMLEALFIRHL